MRSRTRLKDVIGQTFGKQKVVGIPFPKMNGYVIAECVCGATRPVAFSTLKKGQSDSCGCATITGRKFRHGKSADPLFKRTYTAWMSMNARCNNPNTKRFKNYGGRGISICPEWDDFDNFVRDMGICPPKYTIERDDVNGNYCKENCRWIPAPQQHGNKTTSVRVVFNGEEMAVSYACRAAGVPHACFFGHRKRHPQFSPQEIFELTIETYKRRSPYRKK